eukprot:2711966-Pleurochrysis_carterae.AAC.1
MGALRGVCAPIQLRLQCEPACIEIMWGRIRQQLMSGFGYIPGPYLAAARLDAEWNAVSVHPTGNDCRTLFSCCECYIPYVWRSRRQSADPF